VGVSKKLSNIIFVSVIVLLVAALVCSSLVILKKNSQISEMNEEISQNETEIKEKDEKIAGLETDIANSNAEKEQIKSQLETEQNEKTRLEQENSNLKAEIEQLRNKANKGAQTAVNNYAPPVIPTTGNKVCYLTFDDGPSDRTLEILEILRRYGVKATFFVTNTSKTDYLINVHNEGHAIGLHTASHRYEQIYSSLDNYFADLQAISNIVEAKTGVKTNIMRFPGGSNNAVSARHCSGIMTQLVTEVQNRGYYYFDWNVDSQDASGTSPSYTKIVNSVLAQANTKNEICVLMHDASAKRTTVQALPRIIEGLAQRGFRFETLKPESPGFRFAKLNN